MAGRTLTLRRPIDGLTLRVIRSFDAIAAAHALPYMIVGATARQIILEHVWDQPAARATRDVDFAFVVQSWEAVSAIHEDLQRTGEFQADPRAAHRLTYRAGGWIDLIPFGDLELRPGTIAWPPHFEQEMRVLGYSEVLKHAQLVELDPEGPSVRIASIPGMVVLKLLAWVDRGRHAPESRDARDLQTMLSQYEQICGERIWDPAEIPAAVSTRYDYDLKRQAVWLLGADIRHTVSSETLAELLSILDERNQEMLADGMTADRTREGDRYALALSLLGCLRDGLRAHP